VDPRAGLDVMEKRKILPEIESPASSPYRNSVWTELSRLCLSICIYMGHAVAQLVEALCYKPEGRGFDSR
jgi:hypothetical protein